MRYIKIRVEASCMSIYDNVTHGLHTQVLPV